MGLKLSPVQGRLSFSVSPAFYNTSEYRIPNPRLHDRLNNFLFCVIQDLVIYKRKSLDADLRLKKVLFCLICRFTFQSTAMVMSERKLCK